MFSGLAISLSFCLSTIPASAQQASSPARHVSAGRAESKQATRAAQDPWWKHSVIYEIYPRSFQDSNGDGVGDLKGITSRLDYLHDLGIAAIWITPMYPSPLVDFGYDVADYTALDPLYGNLRSEEHTSELQSRLHLVCRLLLEKKKITTRHNTLQITCTEALMS